MNKVNGFRASHRNRWLFVESKVLTIVELSLFEFYIDITDFDPEHKAYGKFEMNLVEIATLFGYSSDNSIRTKHNKLLKLGFILKTEQRNLFELPHLERYIVGKGKWGGKAWEYAGSEKDKSQKDILQSIGINVQPIEINEQPVENKTPNLATNNTSRYLSSSKVHSPIYRTEAEYERLSQENGMDISDMRWIDQNLLEY